MTSRKYGREATIEKTERGSFVVKRGLLLITSRNKKDAEVICYAINEALKDGYKNARRDFLETLGVVDYVQEQRY